MAHATLRQLRYFNAPARHGHFGRAAEACAISRPAMSMQIKEPEEAPGGVLLEGSARQLALTKFGEGAAQAAQWRSRARERPDVIAVTQRVGLSRNPR
jgi:LysR family transcriptional regulator, hydrogen peroxide-inducible genes activator